MAHQFLSSVSGSVLCGLDNFTAISKVSLNYIAPLLVGAAGVLYLVHVQVLLLPGALVKSALDELCVGAAQRRGSGACRLLSLVAPSHPTCF